MGHPGLAPSVRATVIRELRAQKKNDVTIAQELGVGQPTVSKIRRDLGLLRVGKDGRPPRSWRNPLLAVLWDLLDTGHGRERIADVAAAAAELLIQAPLVAEALEMCAAAVESLRSRRGDPRYTCPLCGYYDEADARKHERCWHAVSGGSR